jgi:lipopolysaccharide export system protein LptA/lipopolysaccharide export system protein LptC
MLRSEAARYARWSAAIALSLLGITAVVYVQRGWVRHLEKKKAPPPAPVDVSRQSAAITFRKEEGNQTIFEVTASHSMEFKGQDANLLEDVKITIFGRAGDRHDVIHTQSCRYGKENGEIFCDGDVQIDLLSASDATRARDNGAALATHVETRGVRFERANGLAQTDQPVSFRFPSGSGSAVGLKYQSEEGTVRLLRDVRFTLAQNTSSETKNKNGRIRSGNVTEVHIRGNSLDFGRDTRLLRLLGPAQAETPSQRLSAKEIKLLLDANFRIKTLIATSGYGDQPSIISEGADTKFSLSADTLMAEFAPEGWLVNLNAVGRVHGSGAAPGKLDNATADSGTVDFWPLLNQPREIRLIGSVVVEAQTTKSGDSRTLHTDAFRLGFRKAEQGVNGKVEKAETLAPGSIEWTDIGQSGGMGKTKLQADKLAMDFSSQGQAQQLAAAGNVQTERSTAGHPPQTATARNGTADILPTGGWSQMNLDGDVRLHEGERSGQADHVIFLRGAQTATLTGGALVRDTATETRAVKITFFQASEEIRAEGGVRSTDFSSRGSAVQFAPVPANITANTLQANSRTGRALYSGKTRLWQGDAVLEADSIELLRGTRTLNALGNVRAVFPQVARQPAGNLSDRAGSGSDTVVPTSASSLQNRPKKMQLWHATSGGLNYQDSENHAHLEQNVVVQSPEQQMRAPALDLYFQRAKESTQSSRGGTSSPGAQQISRAVGSGGVVVEQGSRKATAERGEYSAVDGKFVMSGGNPTLYDGFAGTTTGRKLTFFLADDTIIVDSENGSRTVTKHRVEK